MPFGPISWSILIGSFVAGSAAGATLGYFWDKIQEWATRMLRDILDAINTAIEVTSDAVVYLVKEGTRRVYQRMEVYVRNVRNGITRLDYKQKEIPRSEVPDEFNSQLDEKMKMKMMQWGT